MILLIENIKVRFPVNIVYPEQIQIMFILKKIFDNKTHGIMGIPAGIGLSSCVFSFFYSYCEFIESSAKMIYWTSRESDTHSILEEWVILCTEVCLSKINDLTSFQLVVSGIFEKKKLCIEPRLNDCVKSEEIEDLCQSLITPFVLKKKHITNWHRNLIKKNLNCQYFYNYSNELRFEKVSGIWTLNKLRELGTNKKLCPFYMSRNLIFCSDIIIGDIKHFLLSNDFNLVSKKQIRNSYVILDNLYEIDGINTDVCFFQINKLIIEDSQRALMIIKRKIIKNELEKKNLKNKRQINIKNSSLEILASSKKKNIIIHPNLNNNQYINKFRVKFCFSKRNRRIFHLIEIIACLNSYLKNHLKNNARWKYNLKIFVKYLLTNSCKFEISANYLEDLSRQLRLALQTVCTLENRIYSGLIKIGNFFKIISLYIESTNENFRFFVASQYQKQDILPEPKINLICVETSILTKILFEKFKSIIIFANLFLDMKIYILLIDCKPFVYGSIRNFFLKCFTIPISIEYNITNLDNKMTSETFFRENIPRIYSFFINQTLDVIPEGALMFLSTSCMLENLIDEWKNDKVLKKIIKNRKIFIETKNFKKNIMLLEEYKLCIDLGYSALFIGFFGGILYQANLNLKYSRTIFEIESSILEFDFIPNTLPEKFYSYQKKKIRQFWNSIIISKDTGYIANRFFKSKKDCGIIIKITKRYEFNKNNSLSPRWQIFKAFEKESKICPVIKKIKNFFMHTF
nr:DNA repair helicase component of transcription factor b [Cryptomonas sp.]